jgi:hypothetical protein
MPVVGPGLRRDDGLIELGAIATMELAAAHVERLKGKLMIPGFTTTPAPPYYAVIFTSKRTDVDAAGYAAMADAMAEMAAQQPGYLGHESARDDGVGITVSYWRASRTGSR